ncbi:MAG: SigF/SigG family RNA polymerase sporulation sigma factor [Lachnospiraceae bacterium]|nr:SigF/SigG family RNA polymerase sporulation sigma factor [Lachnospiraceae bacterium]
MDTLDLIRQARSGDKQAREQLIKDNMGLVYSIVKRFAGRGHEIEDLSQIGAIGLMKAIDNFDLSFDVKFSTYAVPMISGEIKRFLRDDGMIKVSRSLKDTARKARVQAELLAKSLGREPTLAEIATEIDTTPEDIAVALEAVTDVESLNRTIYQGDGSPIYLMDKIEEDRDRTGEIINRLALKKVMESLEKSDRELIYMRYFLEKTQSEIAGKMGISQVQVSRLEKKVLKTMRERLG